ncbi:hypothetical protein FB382_003990 [Nocardioides ginsengisegetis]|uniref:Uncharacterized protein n=1 Tax=Nocardioides ginsengisegetis TaxID=661491 RepID=A0A7W3J3J1_9ACTN|nr:hypothetical protein [Nocardioides ginsengisegetis]MBA8805645.1 hypothetical protein [Nocardioides ginsengisegetis]
MCGALLAALAGCGDDGPPPPDVAPPPARLSGTPTYDAGLEPAEAVLPLVPATATTLTVTDLDEVRVQLGVPDMTSDDLVTDREQFWQRAATEAPLLTDGLLRPDNSELMLDYGFTEDDVDWEAHFTGDQGAGWVLAFRPDLDMAPVASAVRAGVGALAGGHVQGHLVTFGTATDGADSWATDPAFVGLVGAPAEATYVHRGCLPFADALGPEPTGEDQDRVTAHYDVTNLDPLDAVVLEFGDHLATVRMPVDRLDLFDRLHVGDWWPRDGSPAFEDGFRQGVGDPATGRIGYDVPHPPLAAELALGETLPFGICNSVDPIAEPTGL